MERINFLGMVGNTSQLVTLNTTLWKMRGGGSPLEAQRRAAGIMAGSLGESGERRWKR